MNTSYLSMCPESNFLFHFYNNLTYKNKEKSINLLSKFRKFGFDEELKKIVVEFSYSDLGSDIDDDNVWVIEVGGEWTIYNSNNKKYEKRDLTDELLQVLDDSSIDFRDSQYSFNNISVQSLKKLFEILRICFRMQDYINDTTYFKNTILMKNKRVVTPKIIPEIERKTYNLAQKTLYTLKNITEDYLLKIDYDNYYKNYTNWLDNAS